MRGNEIDKQILKKRWEEAYKLRGNINNEIYNPLISDISEEEIISVIKLTANSKAPGPTLIPYEVFKHMGNKGIEVIKKLFNDIIKEGILPLDWVSSWVTLIPKPKNWEGNLEITRPITLMETLRKIFTKILTIRLSEILKTNNILSGNNYAGLPGGRTSYPIHILNNTIEDAREHKKELWLLFQDISKAFDSVDPYMMKLALQRIKIPEQIINIINFIGENRMARGITEYGPTEVYRVIKGVDQGDSISPLLWCIFYDPLLTEINTLRGGYEMEIKWRIDMTLREQIWEEKLISSMAFMDDTVWITKSKQEMEKILKVAQSFFELNKIKVNPTKSELIMINTSTEDRIQGINFMESDIMPKGKEATRYLGIWIEENG
jgi:Reverse transcriptase (RNA-dependent DNA polymerase)